MQFLALHPMPARLDVLVILPLALLSVVLGSRSKQGDKFGAHRFSQKDGGRDVPWLSSKPQQVSGSTTPSAWSLLPSAWRPHLQTILHTPTSSRIFYFLLLNLAYMGVQMGYGVLTNSLGLISDGECSSILVADLAEM
jgi:zinc transporter 5/7